MERILSNPCLACPYRRDVESGVWSSEEYDKLPPYDAETFAQPMEPFACHASPENLCHGWAVCHSNRGHDRQLISLRLRGVSLDDLPDSKIALFSSGQEASDHGKREIKKPSERARVIVTKLLTRHSRLRKGAKETQTYVEKEKTNGS